MPGRATRGGSGSENPASKIRHPERSEACPRAVEGPLTISSSPSFPSCTWERLLFPAKFHFAHSSPSVILSEVPLGGTQSKDLLRSLNWPLRPPYRRSSGGPDNSLSGWPQATGGRRKFPPSKSVILSKPCFKEARRRRRTRPAPPSRGIPNPQPNAALAASFLKKLPLLPRGRRRCA